MKFLYKVVLVLLTLNIAFADLKLPEVVFPLEIIAEKQEKKEKLQPPKYLPIDENINLDLFINIPLAYPVNLKPVLGELEKPKTFFGFPKDKALVSDIIDNFETGRFLIAYSQIEEFLKKYKKSKYLPVVYYLAGLVNFQLENIEESARYFEKACNFDFYLKDKSCISASAIYLELGNLEKAEKLLNKAKNLSEKEFLSEVIKALKYNEDIYISEEECQKLDIGFVDYCKYVSLYSLYKQNPEKFIEESKKLEKSPYIKYIKLLEGFSYLELDNIGSAEATFENFLDTYGKADNLSVYAIYGYLVSKIKEGNSSYVLDQIGSMEIRDKNLAQRLYILLGIDAFKENKFLDSLAFFQRALSISSENKEMLKKLIAISAYNLGYYQYAYNIFKTINEPKYYLYTAYTLFNLQNYTEAKYYLMKAYKKAEDKNIKYLALKYLADIYYFSKEDKKFIKVLEKLKNYDPDYVSNLLGWYFFRKKEYKKAYKAFKDPYMKAVSAFNFGNIKKAMEIVKNNTDRKSKFLMAYIYLKELKLDKARKILKELSKGNDEIAKQAGYLYAYSFFSNGEYEKSAEEFKKYYEKYKDTYLGKRALLRMADSLYNIGKIEEAKKIYSDFIKRYAGTKEAIDAAYLLTILETKENSADIEKQLLDFINKYPDYPEVNLLKLQLADVYFRKNKVKKAISILEELVSKNIPESEQALYKLGYYYYSLKDYEKAKDIFIKYILKYPQGRFSIPIKQLLADIYEKNEEYEKAIKLYKQLPQTDETKYKLALLYFKAKDYFNAKKLFEDLYNRYPKYKNEIAYYLGKIALKNENFELAKNYFKEAIKGSDYMKVAESYYLLGNIYEKLNDLDKALNSYINIIYLYSQAKDLVVKARIRSALILDKQGKRIEAACMLKPIKNMENLGKNVIKLINNLPECIK
ncbi:tetratricopeptide repeat protein [Hydrogenothermus marinus]|uniref:Tetratricopeptide repeat protein n=1 Tax=Hydrogenothermus marinus TaxID=133270 RepID=A0A3M0C2V4_9AQUI|nr:tetratricopeptide repeat protein [Hydrogenothermus marinus]RMA97282.1 tetratricopeptide repeat protein [Hydrogenothermus marinus]